MTLLLCVFLLMFNRLKCLIGRYLLRSTLALTKISSQFNPSPLDTSLQSHCYESW